MTIRTNYLAFVAFRLEPITERYGSISSCSSPVHATYALASVESVRSMGAQ